MYAPMGAVETEEAIIIGKIHHALPVFLYIPVLGACAILLPGIINDLRQANGIYLRISMPNGEKQYKEEPVPFHCTPKIMRKSKKTI
jgi:hypothetical protein